MPEKKQDAASVPPTTQLELALERSRERDRNYHLGGRSFYFFDFDDNVAFLTTPLVLFEKETGRELAITSGQYAQHHLHIGKEGLFANFEINLDDKRGTFRNFRDHHVEDLERLGHQKQIFISDIAAALGLPDFQWKGPSWSCFYHATFNQRPVSVITARGHNPDTLREGIELFVQMGHLPSSPNFLSVFPVSNPAVRAQLGDNELKMSVAELKQAAIRESVERAIQLYGYSPHHRFGMSDDDPRNIQLVTEEMTRLKIKYPEMSFFMIETQNGEFVKNEIGLSGPRFTHGAVNDIEQIKLF